MAMRFDEATFMDENIFKYEGRLKSSVNKYVENGQTLVTYFSQDENSSTVDRGLQDIDMLFGNKAPLKYNMIENLPICGLNQTNPENNDEKQIEDFNVNGEVTILPCTIVPKPMDFFMIKHLSMTHLFIITSVSYDSMKPEGYYKVSYRLESTSHEKVQDLIRRTENTYHTDLNSIGTSKNPIILKEDYITEGKIRQMMNKMIESYRAMYYSERHNCFLFRDNETNLDWFDMCGNEFMMKYSLMNYPNSFKAIVLTNKLNDRQMPRKYAASIFNWLELGAPARMLQKFHYTLWSAEAYPYSSFVQWGDEDVQILHPLATDEVGPGSTGQTTGLMSYFNETQFNAFLDPDNEPYNEWDKLIWKFIYKPDISIKDVSLYLGDLLISTMSSRDVYLYTPIIVFIIRSILQMN